MSADYCTVSVFILPKSFEIVVNSSTAAKEYRKTVGDL
jgi:hypothetical protein